MSTPLVIGIDMGATNLRIGVLSNGELLFYSSVAINKEGSVQDGIDQIISLIEAVPPLQYAGIGIGVPSVVDVEKGIVYDVQNLPSWKEVHLKEILTAAFNLPVFVNNDANCFALGEHYFGKGIGLKNVVGLTIGSGLGAGLILNGSLYAGSNCGAGEVGMFSYKEGCMEQYASGQFFEKLYDISGKEMFEKAMSGDENALSIFKQFGTHIAKAIENIIYAYDPELIVIGGSLKHAYPFFENELWNQLQLFPYQNSIKNIKIKISDEPNIAVLGAAALVLDSFKNN